MPGTPPVILIFSAGLDIGHTDDQLNITTEFAKTNKVLNSFTGVKEVLGIPSVDLYNASSLAPSPPKDPSAISLAALSSNMAINTTSAFVAAQQAALVFAELPDQEARTFFYTRNTVNVTALPSFMTAGAGESVSAHMMIAVAAAYREPKFKYDIPAVLECVGGATNGLYKFYYVDERKADGTAIFKVDAEAHGKLLRELTEAKTQGPWLQTFVKGVGYAEFDTPYRL